MDGYPNIASFSITKSDSSLSSAGTYHDAEFGAPHKTLNPNLQKYLKSIAVYKKPVLSPSASQMQKIHHQSAKQVHHEYPHAAISILSTESDYKLPHTDKIERLPSSFKKNTTVIKDNTPTPQIPAVIHLESRPVNPIAKKVRTGNASNANSTHSLQNKSIIRDLCVLLSCRSKGQKVSQT